MSQDKNPDRLELIQYSFVSIILAVQDAVQKGYKIHEDTNEFYPKQYGACYIVHMDKVSKDKVLSEDKVSEDKVPDNQQKSIEEVGQSAVVSTDTSEPAKEPATQVDQNTPESSEKATKPAKATESAKVQVQRKK